MKLSIVIPAYNEAQRLPCFLEALIETLFQEFAHEFEIIIVDDGSRDNTADVALKILKQNGRVLKLASNEGKGAAIRAGVNVVQGEFVCITDADCSADLKSFKQTYDLLTESNSFGIIGSRYGFGQDKQSTLSVKRRFFGKLFAFSTTVVLGLRYSDTQCGFKMFKAKTIKTILKHCQMKRFGLDFELLYVSSLYGIKFDEYPIKWTEKSGSKVSLYKDGLKMILEMFQVRMLHGKGVDLTDMVETQMQKLPDLNSSKPVDPPVAAQSDTLPNHHQKKHYRV